MFLLLTANQCTYFIFFLGFMCLLAHSSSLLGCEILIVMFASLFLKISFTLFLGQVFLVSVCFELLQEFVIRFGDQVDAAGFPISFGKISHY